MILRLYHLSVVLVAAAPVGAGAVFYSVTSKALFTLNLFLCFFLEWVNPPGIVPPRSLMVFVSPFSYFIVGV